MPKQTHMHARHGTKGVNLNQTQKTPGVCVCMCSIRRILKRKLLCVAENQLYTANNETSAHVQHQIGF